MRPIRIYLAGKISADDWRVDILGTRAGACNEAFAEGDDDVFERSGATGWHALKGAIFGVHDYVGPFFVSCDHGCAHGPGTHGAGVGLPDDGKLDDVLAATERGVAINRHNVVERCAAAIRGADLVFAWLNTRDAFGTLTEVGMARGFGVDVSVAWPASFDASDLWFPTTAATEARPATSPAEGLRRALANYGLRHPKVMR